MKEFYFIRRDKDNKKQEFVIWHELINYTVSESISLANSFG